jgi:predicted AAA+ superfamily ATPase
MKRIIDYFLLQWKFDPLRKPLLMRGARQVGKTYSIRQLGKTYQDFVEINLELMADARLVFEKDLQPDRIVRELSLLVGKRIVAGKTLLFLDEIQVAPMAITALRYFYELLPELHVIAAGSLLDFAIEQVGMPVGRVQSLYMYPVSFVEYLAAINQHMFINEILRHDSSTEISSVIHDKLLGLLGEYIALGGMPHSLHCWIQKKDALGCATIHTSLLDTYRQDFGKYARNLQVKYVALLFDQIPLQMGRKFKYSLIDGEYRKRELAPALDLLVMAGVAHKVYYTAAGGLPLGAQIDPQDYRAIFLDVGLAQSVLQLDIAGWFLQPLREYVNKGALVEAFVGQEMLAYAAPHTRNNLYYWHKESAAATAEIDYIVQRQGSVVPVEVKSGSGKTLKSMQSFLGTHTSSPYGIRFSTNNYSIYNNIYSYPLYAIAKSVSDEYPEVRAAIENL